MRRLRVPSPERVCKPWLLCLNGIHLHGRHLMVNTELGSLQGILTEDRPECERSSLPHLSGWEAEADTQSPLLASFTGPAPHWAWPGPLWARGGAGALPRPGAGRHCPTGPSSAPHPWHPNLRWHAMWVPLKSTQDRGTSAFLRTAPGAGASIPEAGPPVNTDRGSSFSLVGLGKVSLPTDTSPASPANMGPKPGIPPLQVHSFGLGYKCSSEERPLEPSQAPRTSYALAGLCHAAEQQPVLSVPLRAVIVPPPIVQRWLRLCPPAFWGRWTEAGIMRV